MRDALPPDCREADLADPLPLTPERIAEIAKGLAHPTRVSILGQFRDGQPRMAQDIVAGCTLAQSTVSEHLRVLREAEILVAHKDGPRIWYCLRSSVLRQFVQGLEALTEEPILV